MKLIRFGPRGSERPGAILPDGSRIDCSSFGEDWNEAFFESGGLARLADFLAANGARLPRVEASVRKASAVARPSKIICIGLNYLDHARETKAEIPKEPVIFFKSTSSLAGPDDDVPIPRGASKVDWEVELAFVVGKRAKYVERERALEYVAGFVLHNDYSERGFQLERGGQWVKGKSCDGFAPLGPYLCTLDEAGDARKLGMWLSVNRVTRQRSNTSNMIFDAPTLLSYLSQFMTLLPGDVVSTGTPAGVGLGFDPPLYLKEGDLVELGIDGLGSSRQRIVREAP